MKRKMRTCIGTNVQSMDENNRMTKLIYQGTVSEAMEKLANQLPTFLWHAFIKEKQANSYSQDKDLAQREDSSTCLLQMDFAENYAALFQDEIQTAHCNQAHVTIIHSDVVSSE